ncbi:MAG TPA: adenylate/guanylate cyclase domain-containing protein [Blastocatellia bacterium]|nr:adenylate/guanylate cyclase domain-containing protein [Blastocatellia bacterium]HMV84047.1 adenylate/guanylate cyclase domain-containing protein [Blastocatellia bacterium]HMX30160.1 adenylate/guanylate cyclase domain-containing protein [Blastocatellia bacterium]HMY76298.1 adenylate/guanylate cyclase domain-containing protein [Blastocatellia bacterium]HMZ20332.1 adenylate/guanylate cyclase domain-containing protein [Blastocatellia bacterium]
MNTLYRWQAFLIGDPRNYSLEHRLLNTISLINSVTNLVGSALQSSTLLLVLHLITGILFLACYYSSRFEGAYRQLYWPFVGTTAIFLFLNSLENAGFAGGAHYYFLVAYVIAVILSNCWQRTVAVTGLFILVVVIMGVIQFQAPQMMRPYQTELERFSDVAGNFLFVLIFLGVLITILAQNLNQERGKSERLLLNILPESVAEELKRNDHVQPLTYDCATVLFTDFVGFTKLAEKMTAEELVAELDASFCNFDEIARQHNLEKIKTIGDAYMAAGGLPTPNETHAIDCVLAALKLAAHMESERIRRQELGLPVWPIRIGIHSGPLVAGVIGQEKFSYDVWGDTVNTASRMESSGAPGRINISQDTYELVKEYFDCEYRGAITAKNKGEIEMYFVNGIKPEYEKQTGSLGAQSRFLEHYRQSAAG